MAENQPGREIGLSRHLELTSITSAFDTLQPYKIQVSEFNAMLCGARDTA